MGAEFLQLQWDAMLIEVDVICLWLEVDALGRTGSDIWAADSYASRIGMVMLYWLHFRLMFSSGFVKLSSGCPRWRDGTAMSYHFWTQPLPSPTSLYAWRCGFGHKLSAWASLVCECVVPLTVFFVPLRVCRLVCAANTTALMGSIFLTGNFGFFNILTAALAITCIDDAAWPSCLRPIHRWLGFEHGANVAFHDGASDRVFAAIAFAWFALILVVSLRSLWHISYSRGSCFPLTGSLKMCVLKMSMWSIVNAYGLFARMTTFRHELVFEGTADADFDAERDEDEFAWHTYEFGYKPGSLDRRPPLCLLHLPRLDWRLWFLPLRRYNKAKDAWLLKLVHKLIRNETGCPTLALLQHNPFGDAQGTPIRAVRLRQFEYRFCGDAVDDAFGAKALGLEGDALVWEQGSWWMRRDLKARYMPTVTQQHVTETENKARRRHAMRRMRAMLARAASREQGKYTRTT